MWNGAAEALNASPAMIMARPKTSSASCSGPRRQSRQSRSHPSRRRPAPRRTAEGGAEAADDQVLQRRLQAAEPVAIDRTEDVQGDREPLQRQEQRHQVVRGDEEHHSAAGRREQRVVLADVVLAPALAIRDRDREQTRAGDDDRSQLREPVAAERVHDDTVSVCRLHVEGDREAERRCVAERAERRGHSLARATGTRTAQRRASPAAASSELTGASANQSMCGGGIT